MPLWILTSPKSYQHRVCGVTGEHNLLIKKLLLTLSDFGHARTLDCPIYPPSDGHSSLIIQDGHAQS